MDAKSLKTLEFGKILTSVAMHATSAPAREAILALHPYDDLNTIKSLLAEVDEADRILYEHAANVSFAFDDIGAELEKAAILSMLSMGELLKIYRMVKAGRNLKNAIAKVPDDNIERIKAISDAIYTDKSLEDDIDRSILSENEMSDNASPELKTIRVKIRKKGEDIKTKLNSYITGQTYSKYLQDNIITVRGDRYVIPVKAEYRSSIPGLVHDQSSSGQTFYVEPLAIVELNNDLKTLSIEEGLEIERILKEFTFRISAHTDELWDSFVRMTRLDVIFAKASYAGATKACKPELNNKGVIKITKGRHPLIDKDRVVPTDIRLGEEFDLLFITGPNTGGKTVTLKLVGLLEIMAMSGLFVPAQEAQLSMFDNVFCDIGDEQSIEQNLSTFSSHIANITNIINHLTSDSLILLDELGAGTDPTEGAALAVSISDSIRKSGAKAIITTHYNELKEYAVVTGRVENASMDFDPLTYSPTFRLMIGTPGASNAIVIAEKLGLKKDIVDRARGSISNGKMEFENVLNAMEMARRKAADNEARTAELLKEAQDTLKNAQNERDRLFVQREKLNANVKKETKRLVEEAMEEANEIIDAIKAFLDSPSEQNLFEARKLRKSLHKYVIDEDNEFRGFGEEADGEIREGDHVLVRPLKVEGDILSINALKGTASVKLGQLTSNFRIEDLLKLKSKQTTAKPQSVPSVKTTLPLRNERFSSELNLIGQTTMEAAANLDAYLDKAVLSGLGEVRIIHGHGTGKLRESVQRRLRIHPSVDSIRDGRYDEGGRGVTVAVFKTKSK
ncbi:MAG: endonuclease MutS2 [Clostridia bacterium]|nr:endonuclease MutS2 [Clostridia bacterium]